MALQSSRPDGSPPLNRVAVTDNAVYAPKHWMNFGNADRLGVFQPYRFFSIALPFLYGRLTDRPLCEFLAEYDGPGTPHLMHRLFDRPIFCGMETPAGNADWNRALWAIETEAWPRFEHFILSLAIYSRQERRMYRYGSQDVTIADPLFVDHARRTILSPQTPMIQVVVFGVDGTHGVVAVDAGTDPYETAVAGGPAVRFYPPQSKTVAFAKAMVAGENLPGDAIGPATRQPAVLREVNLRDVPPSDQASYLRSLDEYRKEFHG